MWKYLYFLNPIEFIKVKVDINKDFSSKNKLPLKTNVILQKEVA